MPTITSQYLDKAVFSLISDVAEELGVRAFVIGGYVRDCFLGRPCNDIDVVVEGSGIDFARAVGRKTGRKVSYFQNFGTAMLHYGGDEIEFVGARKESYRRESRKPIVENGTLEDDQKRRDFTINAMAFSLQKEDFGALVDPFGGIKDLAAGIIRTPLDPDTTYSDDPLRMLRAVRFASKLSTPECTFRIVEESMESMRRMASRLEILSCERIAEELNKMLLTRRPSMAFRLLDSAGLLPYILPELSALNGGETVDGAKETVQALFEKGYTLYIVTNGVEHTQKRRLHRSGLDRYIAGSFVSEKIGIQKPFKAYFDYVFNNIDEKDRSKLLLIGDSLGSDIKGALDSGIDCVWYNPKGIENTVCGKPTYEISDIRDLIKML